MKKLLFILFAAITMTACTKDDPQPETDQEELGSATLIFTPVNVTVVGGVKKYETNTAEEVQKIEFKGNPLLPPVDSHLDLHVGDTYRLELKTTDFAGRASEQTFVNKADVHQVFLLGTTAGTLEFEYGDNQVGVTSYITIKKEAANTTWSFIMRHLNPGVKSKIKASDWNNTNYKQFTGANDLELKFSAHLVGEDH